MSTLTKEIVLTRTTAYWPTFNQMSYDYDHFYRIAEREGIQVVIDSKPSLELAADFQPSVSAFKVTDGKDFRVSAGVAVSEQIWAD